MTKAQEVFNKLDKMNLSEKARTIISQSDQYAIVDMFGHCESPEQVEEVIEEYYGEES